MRILPPIELDGGYTLQFIENRVILQITYPQLMSINNDFKLSDGLLEIVKKIYSNFKKLDLKAVGINFKLIVPTSILSLFETILKVDSKVKQIKFEVNADPFQNNIELIGAKDKSIPEKEAMLVVSNFHREIQKNDNIIALLNQRDSCFYNLIMVMNNV